MCSHGNRLIEAILMSSHKIPFSIYKHNYPKLSKICSFGIFSKGLKNEFETSLVNEPSVFEPVKFYCICTNAQKSVLKSFMVLSNTITDKLFQTTMSISYTKSRFGRF